MSLMRKQFSSYRLSKLWEKNRQMTNKKLYCEDVLQMVFADSDSEGEYLRFGNGDRPSNPVI